MVLGNAETCIQLQGRKAAALEPSPFCLIDPIISRARDGTPTICYRCLQLGSGSRQWVHQVESLGYLRRAYYDRTVPRIIAFQARRQAAALRARQETRDQ